MPEELLLNNMNIKTKNFLLILGLALLGTGLLRVNPVSAQDSLEVIFEKTPLFNEANFLPGEGVTRWIKVTNNSGETKKIAIESINETNPDDFASQLNLTIKEGGSILYNDTLANFFDDGEVYLSDLANGIQTQYDLTIVFNSGSGNEYQEKAVGFDILIGFQGEEGQSNGEEETNGGMPDFRGSSGDILPPGLTISEESIAITNVSGCQSCSVTIIWTTSYLSTSEVIYDTNPGKFNFSAGPDKYGYAFIKSGDDSGLEKLISHSVTIYDLLPNTDYYYRVVSHASPASISGEHRFFTYVSENCVTNQIESGPSYASPSEASEGQNNEGSTGGGNITYQELEEPLNEERTTNFLSAGLASIIDALKNIFGENVYIYLIFILLFLIILWLLFLLLKKRKKEEES